MRDSASAHVVLRSVGRLFVGEQPMKQRKMPWSSLLGQAAFHRNIKVTLIRRRHSVCFIAKTALVAVWSCFICGLLGKLFCFFSVKENLCPTPVQWDPVSMAVSVLESVVSRLCSHNVSIYITEIERGNSYDLCPDRNLKCTSTSRGKIDWP